MPKAPREVGVEGVAPPRQRRSLGRNYTLPIIFLLFDLKMEHFRAVFKLDLTEETRTQLHQEEAFTSSCFILATPMLLTSYLQSCCRVTPMVPVAASVVTVPVTQQKWQTIVAVVSSEAAYIHA